MYICKNTSCALAISKAAFPVAMNCPVCQQALIAVIQKTELSEEDKLLVSNLPYVIAYPLKRMLDEADGRNRLELMAYSFLNLMKYIGLVLASEYFNSSIRSKELNELFRNNLYQPSFGNWNAFIRDAIKILSANNIQWIFPEIVDGYTLAELKNSKKYTVESEYTDEDGLLKLRKSDLTAIGALINFRNRYLGHGMPLSNDEYAELFSSTYPIYIDLLKSFSCLKAMKMIKTDRLNQYLLQGNEVKISSNEQLIKEDSIWIEQGDTKRLPLIPFYIIPGKFNAGHTDKTQVLVYEQNTGQRMVFYSPESIKAEATGEILERLQLLLNNKEKEEPYAIEVFNHSLFIERIKLHNDKTLQVLKKEKKVLEGIYQSRGEAEIALIGWTGASAGFFFLAAEAGSGKTNLLVHVRERYEALGYPSLLIRANRMENANLLDELYAILNIPPGSNLSDYGIIGTQENPFMILLDGANEHFSPIELLFSAAALADAFTGGGLKIVISWRVNNLDQVPVVEFSSKETLFNAGQRQYINPLAANAFLLKPMNLVEMEGAWKTYTSHVSKQFKPKFSFEDLLLKDKPLVDQLSNPLLLRLCMEIFNNKGLKSKPKGFTNLWKLWWEQMKNDALESEYLQELANLMAEIKQLQVPLDSLFDVPKLSKAVNNLQVDSPHQQLLRKGIISQFFHEGILQVAFTMEAAYHYVLSASLNENELGEKIKEDFFWEGPAKYKLWDSVYDSESNLLFDLIDDDEFPNKLTGFALAQYMLLHGAEMTLKKLLSNPSSHDWEVLAVALKEIESSRPKEHIQLANGLFDLSIKEYHEYSLSLLISLLQHADKHKADELYRLYIKTEKINSDDNFLALSAYHDKYGRNKEALLCLERAIKLTEAHKNEAKNKLPEFYRLIAKQQMHLGLYKDANVSLDLAEELLRKSQALKNIDVALFNSTRGELYVHQSLHALALDAYNKAHALYLQELGTFHRHTLLALFDVGKVYAMIGEYDKCLEIAENGISLSERALGKLNSIYSDFIQRRGDLFNEKGWYDKALEQYNLALTIELDYFGNNHPYISGSLTRIGDIWENKGDYDKALEYYERAMLIRLQYYGESHPNVASSLDRIGDIWNTKGDYDKALEYFERDMVISLQYYGESHPNVANSLSRIGDIWNTKGDYDKALEYFERAMVIRLQYYGESHPNVASSLTRIGDIWNTKGDYDKALEYFERAMLIRLQYYGESHPNVASSLSRIGDIWENKGDYDKALEYYERAMVIHLQYYGESHPNVAGSLNRIGDIWNTKGDYDKALEYFERAMVIRLQYYGESHPNVAGSLDRIGDIWDNKGDYDKALKYYERAMAINLQYDGESHPNVANSLDRIGDIWNTKGDYDKALEYFERAMLIRLQYYGESHPNVAVSLSRIGGIWNTKGDYDKALKYYERAMAINLQYDGESHPNVAVSLSRIGDIWENKGDYDKALEYYERAKVINLQYYGESHPNVANSLDRIGDIWNTKGDYDKALEYFERALVIRLQYYGESHPNVASSLSRIGDIWNTKGDYDKALEYFERALVIRLQYDGEAHPHVASSLSRIGDIWNTKGDYDKALEYFERALVIRLQYDGEAHPHVASSLSRIGNIWETKGDYNRSLEYYEKALLILIKTLGEEHASLATSYSNIGSIWFRKGEYDKVLEFFEKSLAIWLKTLGKEHPNVATMYFNIGNCNYELKFYLLAIDFFKKGFSTLKKGGFPLQIGKCYEALDNKKLALDYYIQSAEIRKEDPEVGINDESTKTSIESAMRLAKELGKENELPDWMKEIN